MTPLLYFRSLRASVVFLLAFAVSAGFSWLLLTHVSPPHAPALRLADAVNASGARCSTARSLRAEDVDTIMSLAGDRVGSGPTFIGSRVPRRVVFTYDPPHLVDLMPSLSAAVDSWRTDPDAPLVDVAYYGDAAARSFLETRFPAAVVNAWDALIPGAYKADIFRYAEILVHGGLYVDVKITRVAPLSTIVGHNGTLIVDRICGGRLGSSGLWNGIFAAPPGSPWVARALIRAVRNVDSRDFGDEPLFATGPTCLCHSFRDWLGTSVRRDSTCEFLRSGGLLRGLGIISGEFVGGDPELKDDTIVSSRDGVLAKTINPSYRSSQTFTIPRSHYWGAWHTRQVFRFSEQCTRAILDLTVLKYRPSQRTPTFAASIVPLRVVVLGAPPSSNDMSLTLKRSVNSWLDNVTAPGLKIVYYGEAKARAFLGSRFPRIVVDAWDSLGPGASRAALFYYAEALVNGGLYVDARWTRREPVSELVGKSGTLVVVPTGPGIAGLSAGLFAAPRGAPWLARILLQALMNVDSLPYGDHPLDPTGSLSICRGFCNWLSIERHSGDSCDFLRNSGIPRRHRVRVLQATTDMHGMQTVSRLDGPVLASMDFASAANVIMRA